MAESLQQVVRRQLLSAAAAGPAAFEISGVLELPQPLEVYFMDHDNHPVCVTFPLQGNDPTELQPLLDACSPAGFGLGRQTVHDEAVRKALRLPADRLGLNLTTSLLSKAILSDTRDLMMPEAAGPIRAEPYALNVYSPDGFFKAHRDTPASTDMFGSLVICLPTEFTGGQLIIRSPDLSTCVTHDWGSTSRDRSSSSSSGCRLAWAAMYSDCEHEIKPVVTGHRVTLTYNLFTPTKAQGNSSQDSGAAAAEAASAACDSAFGTQLSAALSDPTWYPKGVTLGLVLEHSYAVEPLAEALEHDSVHTCGYDLATEPDNMPDSIEPGSLKGSDLQLYRAARAFGLEVKILPVMSLDRFDAEELQGAVTPEPLPSDSLAVMSRFKVNPSERGDNFYPDSDNEDANDDRWSSYLKEHVKGVGAEHIVGDLVWVKRPGVQHLKYCGPVTKYMGNEGYGSSFYAAAVVLLVVLPPVGSPAERAEHAHAS